MRASTKTGMTMSTARKAIQPAASWLTEGALAPFPAGPGGSGKSAVERALTRVPVRMPTASVRLSMPTRA